MSARGPLGAVGTPTAGLRPGQRLAARRHRAGVSQFELALHAAVELETIDAAERSWDDVWHGRLWRAFATLDEIDAQPAGRAGAEKPPLLFPVTVFGRPRAPQRSGRLVDALDELAAAAHRHAGGDEVIIAFDLCYGDQIATLLWGGPPAVTSSWRDLPRWDGVAVTVQPQLGDQAKLVRFPATSSWPHPVASTLVAPAGLDKAGAEIYRGLRSDRVDPAAAAAAAAALSTSAPG